MTFKRLCDFKGEDEAWDVIGELIDPLSDIATDPDISRMLTEKADKKTAAKYIVSKHKTSATKILALLAGEDYETFKQKITPAAILIGVITVLNDRELIDLFMSQGLTMDES